MSAAWPPRPVSHVMIEGVVGEVGLPPMNQRKVGGVHANVFPRPEPRQLPRRAIPEPFRIGSPSSSHRRTIGLTSFVATSPGGELHSIAGSGLVGTRLVRKRLRS